jgi:tetratricopeptide (TPR) repeat protein
VISTLSFRGAAMAALAVCAVIWADIVPAPAQSYTPSTRRSHQTYPRLSISGSYLAARHAGVERDAAAASRYYRAALRGDPRNKELLSRAFLAALADGEIDEAVRLAERVLQIDKNDRIARLALGVSAIKHKRYITARKQLAQSVHGPITDLAATLLSAWTYVGVNDIKQATVTIDKLSGPDWYSLFKNMHEGMILDVSGNRKEAEKSFERAYKVDPTALRLVQAYASWLSRHGRKDEALKVLKGFDAQIPRHPLIVEAIELLTTGKAPAQLEQLKRGSRGDIVRLLQAKLGIEADGIFGSITALAVRQFQRTNSLYVDGIVGPQTYAKLNLKMAGSELPRLIRTPQEGAAEVLYGLGAALGRRGGEDLGLIYLQLALYLAPNHALALTSLADLYESLKKPELAIKTYHRIAANSPLHRNARIQIALDLDSLNKNEEAIAELKEIVAANPTDREAILALGNVLRGHKKFAECADVYSKVIAMITKAEKANWVIYYFRGICYERSKQWPKAEADLKQALKLFPEQPLVLNYLGYSWVDQGINLDEGMGMIRRAVAQRADDGYIVDSLGWAYFRLGKFADAVKHLERAVELKPEDPTINDHLGDAYWKVGRFLEARFQWAHARDLKPDPEDLIKIEQKLKSGLPGDPSPTTAADSELKKRNGG